MVSDGLEPSLARTGLRFDWGRVFGRVGPGCGQWVGGGARGWRVRLAFASLAGCAIYGPSSLFLFP